MTSHSPEHRPELQTGEGFGLESTHWLDHSESLTKADAAETKRLAKKQRLLLEALELLREEDNGLGRKKSSNYLNLHQRLHYLASHPLSPLKLPEFHRFDSAYWDVPYEPKGAPVYTTRISPQLEVWSGKLSSFDMGTRALVVDMAMRVYASELLQTRYLAATLLNEAGVTESTINYEVLLKRKEAELEAQLLLAMMHSFRSDYALAIAFATPQSPSGPHYLVGSIGAMQGSSAQEVGNTIGWDGSDNVDHVALLSSLPTNMALSYILNSAGQEIAHTPENKVAEITRLNVAPKSVCAQLGISERGKLSQTLMNIIHHTVRLQMPEVEWELFNTQMSLHRVFLKMGFPVEIISEEASLQPTPLIEHSIHGHYFKRTPPIPQAIRVDDALSVAKEHFT